MEQRRQLELQNEVDPERRRMLEQQYARDRRREYENKRALEYSRNALIPYEEAQLRERELRQQHEEREERRNERLREENRRHNRQRREMERRREMELIRDRARLSGEDASPLQTTSDIGAMNTSPRKVRHEKLSEADRRRKEEEQQRLKDYEREQRTRAERLHNQEPNRGGRKNRGMNGRAPPPPPVNPEMPPSSSQLASDVMIASAAAFVSATNTEVSPVREIAIFPTASYSVMSNEVLQSASGPTGLLLIAIGGDGLLFINESSAPQKGKTSVFPNTIIELPPKTKFSLYANSGSKLYLIGFQPTDVPRPENTAETQNTENAGPSMPSTGGGVEVVPSRPPEPALQTEPSATEPASKTPAKPTAEIEQEEKEEKERDEQSQARKEQEQKDKQKEKKEEEKKEEKRKEETQKRSTRPQPPQKENPKHPCIMCSEPGQKRKPGREMVIYFCGPNCVALYEKVWSDYYGQYEEARGGQEESYTP